MPNLSAELDALMQQERWLDAVAFAEENSEVVPCHFDMCWNHGWALIKLDRHREAVPLLETACALDPSSPIAPLALGVALRELSEFDAAEVHLTRSIELKSGHLNRMSLALLYLQTGRADQAERIHLDGLAEKRSRERLESYAAFLGDRGRTEEERAVLTEAESAPTESKRSAA